MFYVTFSGPSQRSCPSLLTLYSQAPMLSNISWNIFDQIGETKVHENFTITEDCLYYGFLLVESTTTSACCLKVWLEGWVTAVLSHYIKLFAEDEEPETVHTVAHDLVTPAQGEGQPVPHLRRYAVVQIFSVQICVDMCRYVQITKHWISTWPWSVPSVTYTAEQSGSGWMASDPSASREVGNLVTWSFAYQVSSIKCFGSYHLLFFT